MAKSHAPANNQSVDDYEDEHFEESDLANNSIE
jgi:hypothetical protein